METTVITLDEVKRTYIAQGNRFADQLNAAALGGFNQACENRAKYWSQVQTPKPPVPMAVEAVFDFSDPNRWRCDLAVTAKPLTAFDPDSLLPVIPSEVDGVGGPIGAQISEYRDGKLFPVAGRFMISLEGNAFHPGMTTTYKGKQYVMVSNGFLGRYWQMIG